MGQALLDELTRPGATIGEAIQRAKAAVRNPLFAQTYNLLGDPAVPTAAPRHQLQLETVSSSKSIVLRGSIPGEAFSGEAVVEWVSSDGKILAHEKMEVHQPTFEVSLNLEVLPEGTTLTGARAYMWSEVSGEDAIGWIDLGEVAESAVARSEEAPSLVRAPNAGHGLSRVREER